MLIEVYLGLNLPQGGGCANLFDKAAFIEKILRLEELDQGQEEAYPFEKGACEDKGNVLVLLDIMLATKRLLEIEISH